jgi:WD40 repeat protein
MVQSNTPSYIIVQSGPRKIGSVDFHPSGKWLAIAGEDSTIRVWNVDMKELLENACKIAGRNFTKAEWDQYFPEDPYHMTCPQWASGE